MRELDTHGRLTASQMASFVADGYLLLDGVVPQHLNDEVLSALKQYSYDQGTFWDVSSSIRSVFNLPVVKGAIEGLVGVNPIFDQDAVHKVAPRYLKGQVLHQDSVIDTRSLAFDIQAFYFCHDTPDEMGPTLVVPGSHLRRLVQMESIGRIKNVVGQKRLACKAGTIAILHSAIWHCAQPNLTDEMRYVYKLRLQPRSVQRNLFDKEGCDSPEVMSVLKNSAKAWQGNDARRDQVNMGKLWRYVLGDDTVDVSFEKALTRMGD